MEGWGWIWGHFFREKASFERGLFGGVRRGEVKVVRGARFAVRGCRGKGWIYLLKMDGLSPKLIRCYLIVDRRRKVDENRKDAEGNPRENIYDIAFLGREQREAQQAVQAICKRSFTAGVTNKIQIVGKLIRRLAKRHTWCDTRRPILKRHMEI